MLRQKRATATKDQSSAFDGVLGSLGPAVAKPTKRIVGKGTVPLVSSLTAAQKLYTASLAKTTHLKTNHPSQPNQQTARIRVAREVEVVSTEQDALKAEEFVAQQLPKTRLFVQKLGGFGGMTTLQKKLESALDMMTRRSETIGKAISIREYHYLLYRFMSEHVGSTLEFLESCSFDQASTEDMKLCHIHFKALTESSSKSDFQSPERDDLFSNIKTWIKSIVKFHTVMHQRELHICDLMKEYEILEEQCLIFREVLRQLNAGNSMTQTKPIEVTIRQITISDKSGYLKSKSFCNRETMTMDENEFDHAFEDESEESPEEIMPQTNKNERVQTLFVPIISNPSSPDRTKSTQKRSISNNSLLSNQNPSSQQQNSYLQPAGAASRKLSFVSHPASPATSMIEVIENEKSPSIINSAVSLLSVRGIGGSNVHLTTSNINLQSSTTNMSDIAGSIKSSQQIPQSHLNLSAMSESKPALSVGPEIAKSSLTLEAISQSTAKLNTGDVIETAMLSVEQEKQAVATVHVAVGGDKPIPKFVDACHLVPEFENPLKKVLDACKKEVQDIQAKLKKTVASHISDTSAIHAAHEKEIKMMKATLNDELLKEQIRNKELELKLADLTNQMSIESEEMVQKDAEIENLKGQVEALLNQVQEVEREKSQIESDYENSNMEIFTLKSEVATLKDTIVEDNERLNQKIAERDAIFENHRLESEAQVFALKADVENAKKEAIDTVVQLTQSKSRFGELHHSLVTLQNHSDRIEELYEKLQISSKTNEYRVKELEAIVETMMKYPDASLGQLLEEPADGRYDELFKEMINSNNMRISMLEAKNNEYRYIRLKHAEGGENAKIGDFLSSKVPPTQLFSLDHRSSLSKTAASRSVSRIQTDAIIPQVKSDKNNAFYISDDPDPVSTLVNNKQRSSLEGGQKALDRNIKNPMPLHAAAEILLGSPGLVGTSSHHQQGETKRLRNQSTNPATLTKKGKETIHLYKHHERLPGNGSPQNSHHKDSSSYLNPPPTFKQQTLVLDHNNNNQGKQKRGISYSALLTSFKDLRNPEDPIPARTPINIEGSGSANSSGSRGSKNKTHFPADEHRGFAQLETDEGEERGGSGNRNIVNKGSTSSSSSSSRNLSVLSNDSAAEKASSMLNLLKDLTEEEKMMQQKRQQQQLLNEGGKKGQRVSWSQK
ncbi:hypothetical protein BDR26DRAFT_915237 [Obelidium mucronatum]|nr:hypothetical protein BDR26DRAFT_915237 [Obelidium mucronatum]